MKKNVTVVLVVLSLMVGVFAGCEKSDAQGTEANNIRIANPRFGIFVGDKLVEGREFIPEIISEISELGVGAIRRPDPDLKLTEEKAIKGFIESFQKTDGEALITFTLDSWEETEKVLGNADAKSEYEKRVKSIVEYYDGDGVDDYPGLKNPIKNWQIGNEPKVRFFWGGSAEQFLEFFVITHDAIKEADPNAKIVSPGLNAFSFIAMYEGFYDGVDEITFTFSGISVTGQEIRDGVFPSKTPEEIKILESEIEKRLEGARFNETILLEGAKYYDALDFHAYNTTEKQLISIMDYLKSKISETGRDIPIIITEFGLNFNTKATVTDEYFSNYLVKGMVTLLGEGCQQAYWFGLRDWEDAPKYGGAEGYGLVNTRSGETYKTAAFYAYKQLISELGDYDKVVNVSTDDCYGYRFITGESDTFVLWSKDENIAQFDLGKYGISEKFIAKEIITKLDKKRNPIYPEEAFCDGGKVMVSGVPVIVSIAATSD